MKFNKNYNILYYIPLVLCCMLSSTNLQSMMAPTIHENNKQQLVDTLITQLEDFVEWYNDEKQILYNDVTENNQLKHAAANNEERQFYKKRVDTAVRLGNYLVFKIFPSLGIDLVTLLSGPEDRPALDFSNADEVASLRNYLSSLSLEQLRSLHDTLVEARSSYLQLRNELIGATE